MLGEEIFSILLRMPGLLLLTAPGKSLTKPHNVRGTPHFGW